VTSSPRMTTIGELCREGGGGVQTGPFGSQLKAAAYVPDGIPTVMPVNLLDYRIREDGIARISPEDLKRLRRHELQPGDIVYGRRGDIGRQALITEREAGWLCGTGCLRIRFGNAPVEPKYISYYLRQAAVIDLILSMAVGTTMPNLNSSILESVPISLPPLPVQRRIAEILGRLDDKIEVNRRINRTLEAMAQALYRHWFVAFGPFRDGEFVDSELGAIPRGWEVVTVGDICQVVNGATPSTKIADYWDGDICWATPTDMTALSAPVIFDTNKKITPLGLENCSASVLPAGSVLVTSRATLGVAAINYVPMTTNQGFKSMICGPSATSRFMLLFIQDHVEDLVSHANGTTFLEINSTNFKGLPLVKPPIDVMQRFDALMKPWFDQIYSSQKENARLGTIRDYLLPKLLAGEIRLDLAEDVVDESALTA
jgi:type I restriction enzyme, S subunit